MFIGLPFVFFLVKFIFWRNYITSYEPILSRIHKPNNRDFSFSDCDTSHLFLRHDELQNWELGTYAALTTRANH